MGVLSDYIRVQQSTTDEANIGGILNGETQTDVRGGGNRMMMIRTEEGIHD